MKEPVRVLVVDDSAFTRHVLVKHITAASDIQVVGQASDGLKTLEQIPVLRPDVITLDIEMPHMDGLTTLEHIMARHPTPVIMLSALTQSSTRTSIRALLAGAVDVVAKPDNTTNIHQVTEELIAKIKIAAKVRPEAPAQFEPPTPTIRPSPLRLNDPVIVIGASTGGPQAFRQLFAALPGDLPAAIIAVQHMPPMFTHAMAVRLNEVSALTIREAAEGDLLARGLALLAPGGFHLCLQGRKRVKLERSPRLHGVRPAVDRSMESVASLRGSRVIGVILTGMGMDGTGGARQIKEAGGLVIAEASTTSVVDSMPRSVIKAGLADRIVPLPEVAPVLVEMVKQNGRA